MHSDVKVMKGHGEAPILNACGVQRGNSGGYGSQYRFFFRSIDSADADNEAAEATGDDETSKVRGPGSN